MLRNIVINLHYLNVFYKEWMRNVCMRLSWKREGL